MVRRVLHLIALVLLVLSGPAQGMVMAGVPHPGCCCGEAEGAGGDLGPCGMPKAPCPPQCPRSGASQGLQAPMVRTARVQVADARETAPRREPAPWPAVVAAAGCPEVPAVALGSPSPPRGRLGDLQAGLCQFRI